MGNVCKKMVIGFIVHKPEESFYSRLKAIDNAKVPAFVYDNSPELVTTKKIVSQLSHVRYISSEKNVGLGIGLYELCRSAYFENFESLLFFDQDTKFNLDTISFIKKFFIEHNADLVKNYSTVCFSGAQEHNQSYAGHELCLDVDFAINSGSLFFLENLEKIGWHNPSYFVDGVDYEFCLRSHIVGFKIGKFLSTPFFDHVAEQPDEVIEIFGKGLLIRKYSAARIKDAVHSYIRLIQTATSKGQFRFAMLFCRSFLIYIFGQILARVPR
jgi:rhamnosyltransferase